MDLTKSFGRDHSKVEDGVEEPLDSEGAYIKVRHRSAQAVQNVVESLTRQERVLWDANDVSQGKGREVFAKILSQGALSDWKGLTADGKNIKNQSDMQKVLSNPKYDPFLEKILEIMMDDSRYGLEDFEEDAKNSETPSDSS